MRALRYFRTGSAAEVLETVEEEAPKPGPGEVRVAIRASGVNPHDTKKRSGWLGTLSDAGGVTPHSDGAGVIDAVGLGVSEARIGERVYVLRAPVRRGTAAEQMVIGADWALSLPEGISFEQGASIGVPSFTAWLAVLSDGPVTGHNVLVHGGGGAVGRLCVEMAAWNGARVIATVGSSAGREVATERGADVVLDRHSEDIGQAVSEMTEGAGVERVIDVDFAANQKTTIAALADQGVVAAYSSTSERMPVLDYYGFALKGARLNFVQGGKLTPLQRDTGARVIETLLKRGQLIPDIALAVPLARAAEAHEAVESGAPANVVVTLGPS